MEEAFFMEEEDESIVLGSSSTKAAKDLGKQLPCNENTLPQEYFVGLVKEKLEKNDMEVKQRSTYFGNRK